MWCYNYKWKASGMPKRYVYLFSYFCSSKISADFFCSSLNTTFPDRMDFLSPVILNSTKYFAPKESPLKKS